MKKYPDVKWSLDKKVTPADIKDKNETELILLRNSIYAQYGFRFSQTALANYFLSRSWYKPTQEWDNNKLSSVSKENVQLLMGTLASMKGEGRAIASEQSYLASQVAYNLFLMGFCTYEVGGDKKAGMIVFEPGGVAKVFHSRASRSQFEAYAYDGYASSDSFYGGSLLIEAKWSVKTQNASRATVLLDYNKDDIARFKDDNGKAIIPAGRRLLLTVTAGNYGFVNARQCSMSLTK